jgi:hypothetical protein
MSGNLECFDEDSFEKSERYVQIGDGSMLGVKLIGTV